MKNKKYEVRAYVALGTSTPSPSTLTAVDRHDNLFGVESGLVFYAAAIRAHIIIRCVNCVHALHAIASERECACETARDERYDSLLNE